ncbi:4-hydroxy-tetrahydrodipicolinate reductase [Anaerocolumna jejuensis]|uniref:4-hydroxy-tetrahydrodipicolinate reductase n=1 Tax=Anaerocolumna jejuensis TaxID=259063 RepID=UPI003F7C9CB9
MVRIILRGCNGRMGQEITRLCKSDGETEIIAGVDLSNRFENSYPVYDSFLKIKEKGDVIIDFSSPNGLKEMLDYSTDTGIPVILCSTGLSEEDLGLVKKAAEKVPILRSANMSLGINTVIKLIKEAAKVLSEGGFDIEIVEKHHNQKLDAPSGTALLLADSMNEVLGGEYDYVYDRTDVREKRGEKEIGIAAVRGGSIVGDHEVIFAGLDEVIEIKHIAYSRAIFAKGAITAAKFLQGKGPGLYTMQDVIV